MGGGGGVSNAFDYSGNRSKSDAVFNERVNEPQQEALGNLYNNAEQLWDDRDHADFNQQGRQSQDYANQVANTAMPGWQNQLGGGFQDQALTQSIRESMQTPSAMGRMYEGIVGGAGNTYTDPAVEAMKQGMMENYNRSVGPNDDMAAADAGQSGSSRHGMQEFLHRNQLNNDMLRNEMGMRREDYDTDLNWKMDIARQADLGRGQAQDRGINMLNMRNMNQQGGLNYGQGMQQIGMGGMQPQQQMQQLPWDQLQQYVNSIGAPTVLGSGLEHSSSRGQSFGQSGSVSGSSGGKG